VITFWLAVAALIIVAAFTRSAFKDAGDWRHCSSCQHWFNSNGDIVEDPLVRLGPEIIGVCPDCCARLEGKL